MERNSVRTAFFVKLKRGSALFHTALVLMNYMAVVPFQE